MFFVFLLTCSLEDYGRSVSSGVIFYVGPVGGLWVCVSYHSYGITSNGPGLYLDNVCVKQFKLGSMYLLCAYLW